MWRGGLGAGLRWVRCELVFCSTFVILVLVLVGGEGGVGEMGEMMANVGGFGGR